MKNMITILLSVVSFSAAMAQPNKQNNDNRDNKNGYNNERNQPGTNWQNGNSQAYYNGNNNNSRDKKQWGDNRNDRRYSDREKRVEMDRINRDYDQRITGYRNNRNMREAERNRQIQIAEQERSSKLKSFGGGLLIGGLLTLLLTSGR